MEASTLEVKSKRIGDHEYKVTVFPAGVGFELLYELKDALGDTTGALFGMDAESAVSKVGGALTKQGAADLVLRLLEFTFVDDRTQGFDKDFFNIHFAGRYGHLFKVLGFVLEANYSDFFDELKQSMRGFLKLFDQLMSGAGAKKGMGDKDKST